MATGAASGALTSDSGMRWHQRVRWLRTPHQSLPWLLDAAVAVTVLLLGILSITRVVPPDDPFSTATVPTWVVVVTVGCQAVPLVVRRRAPLVVLAILLAVCVTQVSLSFAMRSDLGLLVALYSVCRYRPGVQVWCASVVTFAALTFAVTWLPPLVHQQFLAFFFLGCALVAAISLGLMARARQAQLEALADRAARLEIEREQRVRLATVAERARVSREMHDIVGHNLAVIVGLADGAARLAPRQPARAGATLRLIADTSRQALSELRRTLGTFRDSSGRPELTPQPGLAQLPDLLSRVRTAGPHVTYTTSGELDRLTPGLQLTLYRIVQEALTNVLKHAATATSVAIAVQVGRTTVTIAIEDDGSQSPPHETGQGLIGIRERALLAGGTARAGPRPHGGWSVHADIPLDTTELL
jgi:signal transduction histidine kinase